MFEENENLVQETENTEETVEETAEVETTEEKGQFYTDEEFNSKVNEVVERRMARKMREFEKKMAKYKDTENVLKSQLGGENIDEINKNLRSAYEQDGAELPEVYQYEDDNDIRILGENDASYFIKEGFGSMEEEANRLASKGYDNLTSREKAEFDILAFNLKNMNEEKELLSIGVSKDILDNADFKEFRKKFKYDTPIQDIYEVYSNMKPKDEIKTPGSLTNGSQSLIKDRYTMDEISRMSLEDLDDPKVWEAVRKSMTNS